MRSLCYLLLEPNAVSLLSKTVISTTKTNKKPGKLTLLSSLPSTNEINENYPNRIAAGFSYQTWIADLGEWPTYEQLEWDIREMKKMGANSLRVDFVWKHIEEAGDNQFQWDRYDHLIRTYRTKRAPFNVF